jgi:hypothetical protein
MAIFVAFPRDWDVIVIEKTIGLVSIIIMVSHVFVKVQASVKYSNLDRSLTVCWQHNPELVKPG